MKTLKEDMLQEIENEEDISLTEVNALTDNDIKSLVKEFARVAEELKKERLSETQTEQEPVTQTLNG